MKKSFRGAGVLLVTLIGLSVACSSDQGSTGPNAGSGGLASGGAAGRGGESVGGVSGSTERGGAGAGGAIAGAASTAGAGGTASGGAGGDVSGGSAGVGGAAPIVLPAYTSSAATKSGNMGTRNAGHQFEVVDSPIVVRDLGIWDSGGDGLVASHTVTLFKLDKTGAGAQAAPVAGASVMVPAGTAAELEGGFRFAPLPAPVTLEKGVYAVIAYGLNAADLPGDGGGIPLPATGIADAHFDPYEFVMAASPAYPGGGDQSTHANASLRFEAKVAPLRIMPLGASITQGFLGTKAGYRGPLKGLLDAAGITFQYVGSSMENPGTVPLPREQQHHEGHPGFVIQAGTSGRDGIYDHFPAWLGPMGSQADLFLVLVGTNDVDLDYKLDAVEARIDAMVSAIFAAQPKSRIILAQLPPINEDAADARCVAYNQKIVAVADKHRQKGEAVSSVDMHSAVPKSDLADKLHPNDTGYAKVAQKFFDEIQALYP